MCNWLAHWGSNKMTYCFIFSLILSLSLGTYAPRLFRRTVWILFLLLLCSFVCLFVSLHKASWFLRNFRPPTSFPGRSCCFWRSGIFAHLICFCFFSFYFRFRYESNMWLEKILWNHWFLFVISFRFWICAAGVVLLCFIFCSSYRVYVPHRVTDCVVFSPYMW